LAAFGRAYGQFSDTLTADQEAFLTAAIESLVEDGRIICMRLVLFAEVFKSKSWSKSTIDEFGGARGIGVRFLEQTLSERAANPLARVHAAGARRVLAALLPEPGSPLKGHMRTKNELLTASGYKNVNDFAALLRILDGELRLITPTDPRQLDT